MNKGELKLAKEQYSYNIEGHYFKVRCVFGGSVVPPSQRNTYLYGDTLKDSTIAILSYLEYNHNKAIAGSAFEKYNPYLYDYDFGLNITSRTWDLYPQVWVYEYNDSKYTRLVVPPFNSIFDSDKDFMDYISPIMEEHFKEEWNEDYGKMVSPIELDLAKSILKQAGYSDIEVKYLKWVGCDRGFHACTDFNAYMLEKNKETIINSIENKVIEPITGQTSKDAIRTFLEGVIYAANQNNTDIGFNGPMGMCGTYIYEITKEMAEDAYDEDCIVRMPNGKIYELHEGD